MRITGERQSPSPTRLPEKVSPNADTSVPLGAITDAPRSAQVTPHRSVIPGPVMSATLPSLRSRILVPMAPSSRGMHRLDRVEMRFESVGQVGTLRHVLAGSGVLPHRL
jgi:hypothetical protein